MCCTVQVECGERLGLGADKLIPAYVSLAQTYADNRQPDLAICSYHKELELRGNDHEQVSQSDQQPDLRGMNWMLAGIKVVMLRGMNWMLAGIKVVMLRGMNYMLAGIEFVMLRDLNWMLAGIKVVMLRGMNWMLSGIKVVMLRGMN